MKMTEVLDPRARGSDLRVLDLQQIDLKPRSTDRGYLKMLEFCETFAQQTDLPAKKKQ